MDCLSGEGEAGDEGLRKGEARCEPELNDEGLYPGPADAIAMCKELS